MSGSLTAYLANAALTVSDEAMAAAIQNTTDDAKTGGSSGVTYLNFSGKRGTYSLGKDKAGINPWTLFIMEPRSIFTGWQCWKSSKPVAKAKWSIYSPDKAVAEEDLEDHGPYKATAGEGWKMMLGVGLVTTDGTTGMIEFSTDSVSGRNALSGLINEVRERLLAKEPTIPLIQLDAEEFTAQDQKNFKPKFIVDAWVDREAVEAFLHPDVAYNLGALRGGAKITAAMKKKMAA